MNDVAARVRLDLTSCFLAVAGVLNMRISYWFAISVIAPLLATIVSCEKSIPEADIQDTPKQTSAWTGRPGSLMECERGDNFIYGILKKTNSEESLLVLWKWQGDSLKEALTSTLPPSHLVFPAANDLCGLRLYKAQAPHPYALLDLSNGKVLKEWALPGWWFPYAGGSLNGKFIAITAKADLTSKLCPADYEVKRLKIGLIDVAKKELNWVAELSGHGSYTIRQIAVTDDGRYIAIAGWNNGTAMVDARESKVLWAKRPAGEISTVSATFAPDGKLLYTAGSEGCAYCIDVQTGEVVKQLWATPTGESIYGYRVSALACSSDGQWLAAGTGPEGDVYLWNLKQGGKTHILMHGGGTIDVVAFSPVGDSIATVGAGRVKVWTLP